MPALLKESGLRLPPAHRGLRLRLVDSTLIQEPGATGSQGRVLYSLTVPDWQCDFFRLTSAKGAGNGESLKYFARKRGDCLLAERGLSHLAGIDHVQRHGGSGSVRLNQQNTPLEQADGRPVSLLDWLGQLAKPGPVGSLPSWLPAGKGTKDRIPARLCAVRKRVEAAALAQRKLKQQALRKQSTLREATLEAQRVDRGAHHGGQSGPERFGSA